MMVVSSVCSCTDHRSLCGNDGGECELVVCSASFVELCPECSDVVKGVPQKTQGDNGRKTNRSENLKKHLLILSVQWACDLELSCSLFQTLIFIVF